MANTEIQQRRRSPWPWVIGLLLIVLLLFFIIRGMGPRGAAELDDVGDAPPLEPVTVDTRAT